MKLALRIFLSMLMGGAAIAQDIKIIGGVTQAIQIPQRAYGMRAAPSSIQHITLLNMALSDRARETITSRVDHALHTSDVTPTSSSTSVQRGMGQVPVLNQGYYGSCVTFASTAALDAALNKGDYISQLCSLQLGRYLETNAYTPSGWDGSFGEIVLNQMTLFGVVNKTQQETTGCGGLTHYPLNGNSPEPGKEMSPVEYHAISEPINDTIAWTTLVNIANVFSDHADMNKTLEQVKTALNGNERLVFGVLLPSIDKGVAGAVGKHHAPLDSWVLTPEIANDMPSEGDDLPGHEMVITGYDDDAIAIDDHGRTHTGLLTLRNSWGKHIGDKGDFYMSYDYFKALVIEVMWVRSV